MIDSNTGNEILSFEVTGKSIRTMDFGPDGYLYVGCEDGTIKSISHESGKVLATYLNHTSIINDIIIDYQGNLYSCSWDNTIKKVNPPTFQPGWSF